MKREFQIPGHNLRGSISLDVEMCVCVCVCACVDMAQIYTNISHVQKQIQRLSASLGRFVRDR